MSAPAGRFLRTRTHLLLRIGDGLALLALAYVFFLGFRYQGLVFDNTPRGLAFLVCGILGAWAALGLCFGRWNGPAMRLSRWALAAFGVALVWFAVQLVPLPSGLAGALSPPVKESLEAFQAAGLDPPAFFPIAQAPERAARSLSQFFAFICVFALCCMLAQRRTTALWLLLLVAAASVLEGFLAFAHVALGHSGRPRGAVYNPVHSAALVIMALPLATMAIIRLYEVKDSGYVYGREDGDGRSKDLRLMLFGLVIVAGLGWMATLSRGSLVAGVLAIGAWLAVEMLGGLTRTQREGGTEKRVEPATLWIGAAAIALLVTFSTATQGLIDRFSREGIAETRLELTRATFEGLAETRYLGTGLGATESMLLRHVRIPTDQNPIWTHNDIAQWLAEIGVPGALLVLIVLAGFARAFWRNWQEQVAVFDWSSRALQRAAWVGVVITLVHATMDFHLRIPLVSFAFAAVLALAMADGTLYLLRPEPESNHRGRRRRRSNRRQHEPQGHTPSHQDWERIAPLPESVAPAREEKASPP